MAGEYKQPKAARKLTDDQRKEIVARVREAIEDSYNFERDNRREAEIDLDFVAGDQWPAAVKAARGTTRPMLTINQLPQFVQLVTNPTRTADIAFKAVPVGDVTDPQLAKIYDGLFRKIQYESSAKQVYVTANEHQTKCGIGWWRVCTEYTSDEVFEQDIRIRRITNPLAVYCDPASIELDRSDAQWMSVVESWPRKKFQKLYPKAAINSVDVPFNNAQSLGFEWSSKDSVLVAEWWEKVPYKKTIALLGDGTTVDVTGKGEGELGQLDQQVGIVGVREVDCPKVEKYLVTAADVLEGPIEWKGKYIPLIPVIGAETPRKFGTMRYGVVRFARDPQQLLNFYETATAEQIALAPKAPYVVTMKQIGVHKNYWDTLNTENRPYLPYMPDPEANNGAAPKREAPPETPAALMAQRANSLELMQTTTGIYPAAMGARSNETSGVAIGQRQAQTDTANGHFFDNLTESLIHTGRVVADLIPHIYDNERVLLLKDEHDQDMPVTINRVLYSFEGQDVVANDLSAAKFNVRVTVGRNAVTQRVETVTMMLEMIKTLPPEAQVLMLDLLFKAFDWPGSEELARRFRTLVPPEALADPNDPNAPKPPSPMDDPMVMAQLKELLAKIAKIEAETDKTKADEIKTLADADAADAQTGQIVMPRIVGPDQAQSQEQIPEPPAGFEGGSLAA